MKYYKWIFLVTICLTAFIGYQAVAQESNTKWLINVGSHYTGLQDYYSKVAEFDRGKEGFTPEIGFKLNHTKDNKNIALGGYFYDPKRMSFGLNGNVGEKISAKVSYKSFYRQLQFDQMENLQAREAGDREGITPGGKMITHEDKNPGADYGYRRQEIQTDVDFKVSNHIKLMVNHRSILEDGTEQHMQLNHCATCHINSRALDHKQNTHSVSAGGEITLKDIMIAFKSSYKTFESKAGPYTAWYDSAQHPTKGVMDEEFASRQNYSSAYMPIAQYAEIEKIAHSLKVKAKLGKGRVLAQFVNSTTTNKTKDLNLKGNQANVKLIYPLMKKAKVVGTGSYGRFENDPVFVDLPPWRDGRSGGGQDLDWTRYSNLTRTNMKAALEVIYQPVRKYRLSLLGGFNSLERDDYPYYGANNKTTKMRLQTSIRYRPSAKFTGRFKYYLDMIDNPFAPYNQMFEKYGKTALTPWEGNGAVYYVQRDDIRYGDITSQPTMVHAVNLDLKFKLSKKANLFAKLNYRKSTNSDEKELDFNQTLFAPSIGLNLLPSDKVNFFANYSLQQMDQNGLAAVAMMDG